jgi:Tfp pilus assembly protein PilV
MELLVAMAVTVIGLLGLMSMHKTGMQGNQASSRLIEATAIAQQTMEEIRSLPLQSADPTERTLLTVFGVADLPIVNGALPPIEGRAGMAFRRTVNAIELTGTSPDLVRIHVVISWTDNGADPDDPDPRFHHRIGFEVIRTRQDIL